MTDETSPRRQGANDGPVGSAEPPTGHGAYPPDTLPSPERTDAASGISLDNLADDALVDLNALTPKARESNLVWQCTRCNLKLAGNPRFCWGCGHTIYRPTWEPEEA